jgi:hypothetical protein
LTPGRQKKNPAQVWNTWPGKVQGSTFMIPADKTGDNPHELRTLLAVEMAELLGIKVFPVWENSKKPCIKDPAGNATIDAATIRMWARKYPRCNFGGFLPPELIAIDEDRLDGGDPNKFCQRPEIRAELDKAFLIVRTARGGFHYYFRQTTPGRWFGRNDFQPKVDIRTGNDYWLLLPGASLPYGIHTIIAGKPVPLEDLTEVGPILAQCLDHGEKTPGGAPRQRGNRERIQRDPVCSTSSKKREITEDQWTNIFRSFPLFCNVCKQDTALDLLIAHGWQIHSYAEDDTVLLTRPGKSPDEGHSAYWNHPSGRNGEWGYAKLTVFSGAKECAPFTARPDRDPKHGQGYTPFDIISQLATRDEQSRINAERCTEYDLHTGNFGEQYEPGDVDMGSEVRQEAKKEAKVNTLIELAQSLAFNAREYSVWEIAGEMPDPVVPFLVSKGDFLTFIGQSKVGKTWVSMDMAISFACGVPWLGKFEPDGKKRVLFLDGEMKGVRLKERLMHIVQNRGLEFPADHLHFIPFKNNRTDLSVDALSLYEMAPKLKEIYQPDLVLIDNMRTFHPHGAEWYLSESDDKTMSYLARLYRDICDELGSALILTHHATKGEQSFKDVIDMGSGSGALGSQTDGQIVMRRVASKGEDGSPVRNWSLEANLRDWPGFGYTLEKDGPLYNITGEICDPDETPTTNVKPAPNALPLPFFTIGDIERAFAGAESATLAGLMSNLRGSNTPNGKAHKRDALERFIQGGILRESGTTNHKGVTHKLYSIVLNRQAEIDLGITGGQAL